jgi:hypothetical protein
MHTVGPSVAQFLFHRPAREIWPCLIEERTPFVRPGNPHERCGRVSHRSEALFIQIENVDGFRGTDQVVPERPMGHFHLGISMKPSDLQVSSDSSQHLLSPK